MPICPNCNKEIIYLKYNESIYSTGYGDVQVENGRLSYEETDEDRNSSEIVGYNCPECNHELFTREAEVLEFLRNNTDSKLKSGIFFCEKHKLMFDESCSKCIEEEV